MLANREESPAYLAERLPCIVHDLDELQVLETAIGETLHRVDVTPLDEAKAYKRLVDDFGKRTDQIATTTGKTQRHVQERLKLLTLPLTVQDAVNTGAIGAAAARALGRAKKPTTQIELAHRINAGDLRAAEADITAAIAAIEDPPRLEREETTHPRLSSVVENEDQIEFVGVASTAVEAEKLGARTRYTTTETRAPKTTRRHRHTTRRKLYPRHGPS